jgi:DNA topoisomerase IA
MRMIHYFLTTRAIIEVLTNRAFVSGSNERFHPASIANTIMDNLRVVNLDIFNDVLY